MLTRQNHIINLPVTYLYLEVTKEPMIAISTKKLPPIRPIMQIGPQGP